MIDVVDVYRYPPNVHKALDGMVFIASHLASADDSRRVGSIFDQMRKFIDCDILLGRLSLRVCECLCVYKISQKVINVS